MVRVCGRLLFVLFVLSACASPPPRSYGELRSVGGLAAGSRVAVVFAPPYNALPPSQAAPVEAALRGCIAEPLRSKAPDVEVLSSDRIQAAVGDGEPATLRDSYWRLKLSEPAFLAALDGSGFDYVIELQDQSSGFTRSPQASSFEPRILGSNRTSLIRLRATIVNARTRQIIGAYYSAADSESRSGLIMAGPVPVPYYIPASSESVLHVCRELGAAVAGAFTRADG